MSEVPNLSKATKAPAKSASMVETIETALRQATWDATKGPAHLRAGRFDPEAPAESGRALKRPA
jgi:hypothetical protein